jgi:ABC-type antimicrobial peptide transport system permease subunit
VCSLLFLYFLLPYTYSEPFIVPVRDALDSIASAKVFRDYVFENKLFGDKSESEKNIDVIISRYKAYIEYLVEHPKFFIAPFHEFTKDHNLVVDKIIKFYPNVDLFKNKNVLTKEEIFLKIKETAHDYAYHTELGNFPREDNDKKYQIKDLLTDQYKQDIQDIQDKIDILYQRYYDIQVFHIRCYNSFMSEELEVLKDLPRPAVCCAGCTCEDPHKSKPE